MLDKIYDFYIYHPVIFWIFVVELFPMAMLFKMLFVTIAEKTIESCIDNKLRENRVASILYFFKDLGPNTASFSIVTLIVDMGKDDGLKASTVWVLTIVFFVGIILKEKSRKYINIFYKILEAKRSLRWEQLSE